MVVNYHNKLAYVIMEKNRLEYGKWYIESKQNAKEHIVFLVPITPKAPGAC